VTSIELLAHSVTFADRTLRSFGMFADQTAFSAGMQNAVGDFLALLGSLAR
jgi:hypothetical protein